MPSKAGLYGLASATLVVILIAIVIPINKWQNKNELVSRHVGYDVDAGLWKFCNTTTRTVYYQPATSTDVVFTKETLASYCHDIVDVYSSDDFVLVAIVQFSLFACLACIVLAMLGTIVKLFILKSWKHEKQQIVLGYVTAFLAFLAGILSIVAFGVFDAKLKFDGYTLQAAFYLTVVAWLLSWLTAGLFLAGGICIGARMYP